MYAKLQNGFLRSAPKTIVLDGRTINNPLPEELEQLGYKQAVYVDMPTEAVEGKHWNPDGRKKRMRLGRCGHWWTTQPIPRQSLHPKKESVTWKQQQMN